MVITFFNETNKISRIFIVNTVKVSERSNRRAGEFIAPGEDDEEKCCSVVAEFEKEELSLRKLLSPSVLVSELLTVAIVSSLSRCCLSKRTVLGLLHAVASTLQFLEVAEDTKRAALVLLCVTVNLAVRAPLSW